MVITIDGHAGAGKSTAARQLAAALGFDLLNTGAMYRAAAWCLAARGIDIFTNAPDEGVLGDCCGELTVDFDGERVRVGSADVTELIQTEDYGRAASRAGTFLVVRRRLQAEQRRLAAGRDLVTEGRDQGSVVFPDAVAKFFFTAAAELRARRRAEQLGLATDAATLAALAADIRARDRQDATRDIDPLIVPGGAVVIDTTHQSQDAVLALLIETVQRCRAN